MLMEGQVKFFLSPQNTAGVLQKKKLAIVVNGDWDSNF